MKRLRLFILGIIGPYLSIGGAIHLDNHPVFQHLIPYHPLIALLNVKKPEVLYVDNDRAAADIAHILRVLKRCLDELSCSRPEDPCSPDGSVAPITTLQDLSI
jgi:hypothetical protein